MDNARIKISVVSGEIEIEGTESFVSEQINNLEKLVGYFKVKNTKEKIISDPISTVIEVPQENSQVNETNKFPDNFGEWFHKYPKGLIEDDIVLLTGLYIQNNESENNSFKTRPINKTLLEQGVKISNTSASLTNLKKKKLIIQVGKDGSLKSYRISTDGKKHIDELLGE